LTVFIAGIFMSMVRAAVEKEGKKRPVGNELIKRLRDEGIKSLVEPEVKEILRRYSIPVPEGRPVRELPDALEAAAGIGYPVVLKLVSRDVSHKTDVGGVALGLESAEELEGAWNDMLFEVSDRAPTARVEGFLVEKMAERGVEVIAGAVRDEQFGPAVMFGIGGVAVELMKDVSFRLAPVERDEAVSMIKELRGYPLLTGYRGAAPCDLDALADVIVKLSGILGAEDGMREIEINPLIAYGKGLIAVDARASLV